MIFSRRIAISFLFLGSLVLSAGDARGQSTENLDRLLPFDQLRNAKRVLFLGDSITASGGYVAYFDAWLRLQNLPALPVLINCGLASETVSGLSEDGHAGGKFPRPDLFERLDRVLPLVKPDLVFACYGINCGIYQPFDEARFAKYQAGIQKLKDKVTAAGAKLIIITPPFYDDRRKPGPFSYNEVLDKYATWLREKGMNERDQGWRVIDLHSSMNLEMERRRKEDPAFTYQPDGVHPNDAGHWYMARQLIRFFTDESLERNPELAQLFHDRHNLSPLDTEEKQKAYLDLIKQRMAVLRDAYVGAAGHKRPGVKSGLPIAEAEQKYREYTAEIDKLLAAKAK